MKYNQIVVVTGLIEKGDKVLVGQRHKPGDKTANGLWETPGGKVEFGETINQALVREIREETGLRVQMVALLPQVAAFLWPKQKPRAHFFVLTYYCKVVGGKLIKSGSEHSNFCWIGKQDLVKLKFTPGSKRIIKAWFYEH